MKKILDYIERFVLFVLVIMVFINVYSLLSEIISNKGYVNFMGYSYFEVASNSMKKEFKKGNIIIIKLTNKFDVDDIVTYKDSDFFVTHRVIEKNSDYFIPKGDNNNTDDGKIDNKNVIGVYQPKLNFIGDFIELMRNQYIIMGILIVFIIIDICGRKLEKK